MALNYEKIIQATNRRYSFENLDSGLLSREEVISMLDYGSKKKLDDFDIVLNYKKGENK